MVVFPRPLKPYQHDDRRSSLEIEFGRFPTKQGDQFFVDNLGHHLCRRHGTQNLFAYRPDPHSLDEPGNNLDADIRFEQSEPDLPQGGVDVVLGQMTLTSEGLGDASQTFLQPFQHGSGSVSQHRSEVKGPS